MNEAIIEQLGRQGDGMATVDGREVFIPFTLPGETVEVSGSGSRRNLERIVIPASDRVDPPCSHFGVCGGCQLQHLQEDRYLEWKQALLADALAGAGIDHDIEPLHLFAVPSRRRAVFQVSHNSKGFMFGFAERRTGNITGIDFCSVLVREISNQLPALKKFARILPHAKKPYRLSVLSCANGLDLDIGGLGNPGEKLVQKLIQAAIELDFSRISNDGEILVEQRKPELGLGGISVNPPPGVFVQAVKAAETAMVQSIVADLSPCKNVADLYCGMGTFALRLARESEVLAIEENREALEALDAAWRSTGGQLKQIRTEKRNLERTPVLERELNKFDGVVFDPPRAGAEVQAKQIAKSKVPRVAAVSCNPVTLARDLRILLDGGYAITRIMPLDQFRFTPHLEVVTLLRKD